MRLFACLVPLLIVSCSSPAKPPTGASAAVPDDKPAEYACGTLGHGTPYGFRGGLDVPTEQLDAAQHEYDLGSDAADPSTAAKHYLACAAAYRVIPDGYAEIDLVIKNTRLCYQAAMIEYYNAQLLEREGRAAVTAALASETRVKADMEAELAVMKECGPPEE